MSTPSTLRYLSGAIAEPAREQHERLLERQADDADGEDGNDDVLDLEVVPFVPHPEPYADAAGEHFRRDDHQPRDADGQAHAGDHVRQYRGKQDPGEDLPF